MMVPVAKLLCKIFSILRNTFYVWKKYFVMIPSDTSLVLVWSRLQTLICYSNICNFCPLFEANDVKDLMTVTAQSISSILFVCNTVQL